MCSKAVKWSAPILVAAAVAAAAISAAAAQVVSSDKLVQERQRDMKAMAAAAKRINDMFKGTSPYDAKAFKAAAESIRAHSGERLSSLFDGSVTAAGSKASSIIETERPKFHDLAAELGVYASALSIAANRNPDVLGPEMRMQGGDAMMGGPIARKPQATRDVASIPAEHAFHMMLQTCTSCHAKFRLQTE
ncbi:cytochrome c [Sinorhizobium alkalisoli]|uniref:cytochrome c n=1 Tax=Sinorhizobium alkalisoli TaxID=1752398 RepID=UPI00124C18F8|nr:cytochrome c [Sinorhizobium alkalisoli]QFI68533.1 putative cytochrome C-like protein [Sinorhizobium alkalisoli]